MARDLKKAFPGVRGFSTRNLKYMLSLAKAWPDPDFVQHLAAQIPWFHNCILLDKVKDTVERQWYIRQTIQHGWSRNVLALQIESGLFRRQGKALTNFPDTLPAPQSDLAQELLKDPYHLDFLPVGADAQERELQRSLVAHLRDFLLELGAGFAFVSNEYRLEVEGDEFFIDLLFYHLGLSCFIVIELKTTDFKPEYAGKLNFYCSVVDDQLRREHDHPTIGMILCRGKKKTVVEYALRGMTQPLGVSEMQLTEALPAALKDKLPTVEALEAELEEALDEEASEGPSAS